MPKYFYRSLNIICESPFHNTLSPPVYSTTINWTLFWSGLDPNWYQYNTLVINQGTIVFSEAQECNGILECHDNRDEYHCGFHALESIAIGKIMLYLYHTVG